MSFNPSQPRDQLGRFSGSGSSVRVFHGTMRENLSSIIKHGLRPGQSRNHQRAFYKGEQGRSVFVASNRTLAHAYASSALEHRQFHGMRVPKGDNRQEVVVEAVVPRRTFASRFKPDEHNTMRVPGGAARSTGAIKPEQITAIHFQVRKPIKAYLFGDKKYPLENATKDVWHTIKLSPRITARRKR